MGFSREGRQAWQITIGASIRVGVGSLAFRRVFADTPSGASDSFGRNLISEPWKRTSSVQGKGLLQPLRNLVSLFPIDVSDEAQARRVAFLACQEGCDYWLDVVDPNLSGVTGVTISSKEQKAAAVAAIIEMALLNSTHIVAVMTANTRGSEWVPYEYGRVKTPQLPISLQAACWADPRIGFDLPGYLYLGEIDPPLGKRRQAVVSNGAAKTAAQAYRTLWMDGSCTGAPLRDRSTVLRRRAPPHPRTPRTLQALPYGRSYI